MRVKFTYIYMRELMRWIKVGNNDMLNVCFDKYTAKTSIVTKLSMKIAPQTK